MAATLSRAKDTSPTIACADRMPSYNLPPGPLECDFIPDLGDGFVAIHLDAPLGSRKVIDATTGERIPSVKS